MKWIRRLLVYVVVAYLAVLGFIYFTQRNFIYFPINEAAPAGFEKFYNVDAVDINVDGIGDIKSYFRAPPENRPLIIVFHGNASENYQLTNEIESFHTWNTGFLMASYPGYGRNPGKPAEGTFLASAEAHYHWAVSQGIDPKNIVLYGHSLGAASAVHLASENDIGLLVLSAPFLSARAMARRQMPVFPTNLLLKDQFRSDQKMKSVSAPLIVFHGRKDRTIPHRMGEALAALHAGETKFISIENGNHNNLWGTGMPDQLRGAIAGFMSSPTP